MPFRRSCWSVGRFVLLAAWPMLGHAQADTQSGPRMAGDSLMHLAGYAYAGYASSDEAKSFDSVGFSPIFHFTYRDQLMFEAEVEITAGEDGETETELEYGAIDWFFSDQAFLVAGKFLSPVGYFFQNLHPSWINRLPIEPLGFGHDGAAPLTDIGVQLRGGLVTGEQARLNYALYVANGPELEGADGSEIEAIAADGFVRDADKRKTVGGRVAWLPWPNTEIGLSGATGKTAITSMDGVEIEADPRRDYDVLGADFWTRPIMPLELRGEYIQQKIGDQAASIAPEGGTWKAWYVQGAWRIAQTAWEGVLRYGELTTPSNRDGQRQLMPGILYHIAPHAQAKLAYERNTGEAPAGMGNPDDRVLVQLAYGF